LNRPRRFISPAASNENRPARGRGRWQVLPVFGDGAGRPDRRSRIWSGEKWGAGGGARGRWESPGGWMRAQPHLPFPRWHYDV